METYDGELFAVMKNILETVHRKRLHILTNSQARPEDSARCPLTRSGRDRWIGHPIYEQGKSFTADRFRGTNGSWKMESLTPMRS